MRKQLRAFSGYEVTTEGDAFVLAFHTPLDALGWCANTQQVVAPVLNCLLALQGLLCVQCTLMHAVHAGNCFLETFLDGHPC